MTPQELTDQKVAILRTLDKSDKIGADGVVKLLQKDYSEFGAELDPVRANLFGEFLNTRGSTNEETLDNLGQFIGRAGMVKDRLNLMCYLDSITYDDGSTAWDALLCMRHNADGSWDNNGRPANIGWALDDIVKAIRNCPITRMT